MNHYALYEYRPVSGRFFLNIDFLSEMNNEITQTKT